MSSVSARVRICGGRMSNGSTSVAGHRAAFRVKNASRARRYAAMDESGSSVDAGLALVELVRRGLAPIAGPLDPVLVEQSLERIADRRGRHSGEMSLYLLRRLGRFDLRVLEPSQHLVGRLANLRILLPRIGVGGRNLAGSLSKRFSSRVRPGQHERGRDRDRKSVV